MACNLCIYNNFFGKIIQIKGQTFGTKTAKNHQTGNGVAILAIFGSIAIGPHRRAVQGSGLAVNSPSSQVNNLGSAYRTSLRTSIFA